MFFVNLPQDEYGDTGYPKAVIEATPEPGTEDSPFGARLIITAPAEFVERWPTVRQGHGWVEAPGPARMLSWDEHRDIAAQAAARQRMIRE